MKLPCEKQKCVARRTEAHTAPGPLAVAGSREVGGGFRTLPRGAERWAPTAGQGIMSAEVAGPRGAGEG